MTPIAALDPARVAGWRAGWHSLMAGFVPGLPAFERVTAAAVEALRGGPPRRILDLGGGPGVFAERLLARWPDAQATLVDVDPVLLALARSAVGPAVCVVDADLTTPGWAAAAGAGYDLVTAVMTVHYLPPDAVRALYETARRLLAPGGVLVVADLMPDDGLPALMAALDPAPEEAAAELAWAQWWSSLREAADTRDLMAARAQVFARQPPAEFTAGASWHASAALSAGFTQAGLIWRDARHAALAALH